MLQEINPAKFRSGMKSCNQAARQVLEAVFAAGKPADRALSHFFRENRQCGARDRHLISEAVFALLRYWGFLRKFLPEARRLELESGQIRIGRVELDALLFAGLYLEGNNLPAADAIAKMLELPWPKPNPAAASPLLGKVEGLAALFGVEDAFSERDLVPVWVWEMLPPDFPVQAWLAGLQKRPPMWLRVQTPEIDRLCAELQAAGLAVSRHPVLSGAVAVENPRVNLFTLDAFRRGEFEVQDLASQCIATASGAAPGQRWLDACAGAGGKTLALADRMHRTGTVVACDVRGYKLDDLRKRAARAGFPNIQTREWDGKAFKGKQQRHFDGVLVDAPCTCSGVWRRNPDGRWHLQPGDVAEMAALQQRILEAAETAVKPGGTLLYATCSLFGEENRAVVEAFLQEHHAYALEPFAHPLTGEHCDGCLQIYSSDADCDCMFMARMRRSEDAPE